MMQWDGAGEMKGQRERKRKRDGQSRGRGHELRDCFDRGNSCHVCTSMSLAFLWTDRQCNAGSKYELQGRSQWRTCIDLFAKTGSWAWAWDRGRDVGMH